MRAVASTFRRARSRTTSNSSWLARASAWAPYSGSEPGLIHLKRSIGGLIAEKRSGLTQSCHAVRVTRQGRTSHLRNDGLVWGKSSLHHHQTYGRKQSWHKVPSSGSTPRRASASSPPTRAALTSSSTTPPSRVAASVHWTRTSASASKWPRARRAPRPRTSRSSSTRTFSKKAAHWAAFFGSSGISGKAGTQRTQRAREDTENWQTEVPSQSLSGLQDRQS